MLEQRSQIKFYFQIPIFLTLQEELRFIHSFNILCHLDPVPSLSLALHHLPRVFVCSHVTQGDSGQWTARCRDATRSGSRSRVMTVLEHYLALVRASQHYLVLDTSMAAQNWVMIISELRRYQGVCYKSDITVLSGNPDTAQQGQITLHCTVLYWPGLDLGDRQVLEQKYSGCDPPCLLDSSDGRSVDVQSVMMYSVLLNSQS